MDIATLIGYLFSALTGIAGWIVGRKKQNNNFISELQDSINLLAQKNSELLKEVVDLRQQNAGLLANQAEMKREMAVLRKENAALKKEVENLNDKLSNVKTITRKP